MITLYGKNVIKVDIQVVIQDIKISTRRIQTCINYKVMKRNEIILKYLNYVHLI